MKFRFNDSQEYIIGNETDGAVPERFTVAEIIMHDLYRKGSLDHDIAVIKFEPDVRFKAGISPVCLPSKSPKLLKSQFESVSGFLAGWGRTGYQDERSPILRQTILSILSNSECKERFVGLKGGK